MARGRIVILTHQHQGLNPGNGLAVIAFGIWQHGKDLSLIEKSGAIVRDEQQGSHDLVDLERRTEDQVRTFQASQRSPLPP